MEVDEVKNEKMQIETEPSQGPGIEQDTMKPIKTALEDLEQNEEKQVPIPIPKQATKYEDEDSFGWDNWPTGKEITKKRRRIGRKKYILYEKDEVEPERM